MGNVGQTAYAATKAALLGAAKSIAREYASRNITVNVVAPGFIDTDMTAAMTAEQKEQLLKVVPLGRTGSAQRHRRGLRLPRERRGRVRHRPGPARQRRHVRVNGRRAQRAGASCSQSLPLDSSRRFSVYEATEPMAHDIPSEVKRIIKEQLDVDEKDIKPESSFIDDLGADSLGLVELVLAFEEAFEIDIPDEDTEKIRTVQDAIDYIEKHAKK